MSGKTADIAARKSGFGSAETFERAKAVVDTAIPELVEAMDQGKVSISAAHAPFMRHRIPAHAQQNRETPENPGNPMAHNAQHRHRKGLH